MRLSSVQVDGRRTIAVRHGTDLLDLGAADPKLPADLSGLLADPAWRERAERARVAARALAPLDEAAVAFRPVLPAPPAILCLGLNYADHAAESPYERPDAPVVFARFASGLVGHGAPLVRPRDSEQLDYEGELAVVLGARLPRHAPPDQALAAVAGYAPFDDGSVRDVQFRTHQWTLGKNVDGTGGFGPELVTADELPPGAAGLTLTTTVSGVVMQKASTSDLLFGVAEVLSLLSAHLTLGPGDVVVTGTPGGIGWARDPQRFLVAGDVVEVDVEGVGRLRNPVVDEVDRPARS